MPPPSTPLAAFVALVALAPAAVAKTETATSGPGTATLSFDHDQDSFKYANLLLTITRNGTQILSADPSFGNCQSPFCGGSGFTNRGSVLPQDLGGNRHPHLV